MAADALDGIQAIGIVLASCWMLLRGMFRLNSSISRGSGNPEIPNPYRPDSPREAIVRRYILIGLVSAFLFDCFVIVFPDFPFTQDKRLYWIGVPLFGGLAVWHLLYLKGMVKKRTLWSTYINPDTHENRVKEILVLRAHERGERIPTVNEVQEAAKMSEAEFNMWLNQT